MIIGQTRRLAVLMVSILAMLGLVLTAPAWVNPASAATAVTVNVTCTSNGDAAFNAVYEGQRNTAYNAYYKYSWVSPNAGGGKFAWTYFSRVATGSQGLGSTNTVYLTLGTAVTKVTVEVKINGVVGSASDTC